ncbi:MAG: PAS domain-containing sensor histidine kinase, partial [Massilia sp.]|nr:PAS domain-containing sensor histidine kinase [Massilia sp.]
MALSPLSKLSDWWQHLPPQRQDRFAVLAPLAAVLLFFAAIASAFGYLQIEEVQREQEAVSRDVEYTQQRLRLRLLERQEQLMRIARELSNRELGADNFHNRAEGILNQYPELQALTWVDDRKRIKASFGAANLPTNQLRSVGSTLPNGE